MIQAPVPELADGGYWYVLPRSAMPGEFDQNKPIPGIGWCAWYGTVNGVALVAIRTPEPVSGLNSLDVPSADVLAADGYIDKPYGRIGGG